MPLQLVVGGAIAFLVTVAAAELLYRGVELPSHHAGRRRFRVTVERPATPARVDDRDDRRDDLPEPTPV